MPGIQIETPLPPSGFAGRPPYPTHVSGSHDAAPLEETTSKQRWDARRSLSGQSMFVEMLEEPEPTHEQLEVSHPARFAFRHSSNTRLLSASPLCVNRNSLGIRLLSRPILEQEKVIVRSSLLSCSPALVSCIRSRRPFAQCHPRPRSQALSHGRRKACKIIR